ncbi:MAG TPA: hypothetical protein GXX55_01265 [Firmicutes bacterium]|nr:hypothetical protein [Bacillota bacterium]
MALPATGSRVKVASAPRIGGRAPVARHRGRSRLVLIAALILSGVGITGGLWAGVRWFNLDLLEWAGQVPFLEGVVRTYRLGLQNEAQLVEAERGIAARRAELDREWQRLAEEREALAARALELDRKQSALEADQKRLVERQEELTRAAATLDRERRVARLYQSMRPREAAAILSQRPLDEVARVLLALPAETGAAILAAMDPGQAGLVLERVQAMPGGAGLPAGMEGR